MRERVPTAIAAASLALALAACGGTVAPVVPAGSVGQPSLPASLPLASVPEASPAAPANAIVLVALGDSGTTGHGDPSGKGWVQYFADEVQAGVGRPVTVENLAVDGTTSAALLDQVQADQSVQGAIAAADIIVIGIGGNDLNLGDEALQSGACQGKACYDRPIADYRANLAAVAAGIAGLHANKPLVLRAIGMPNALTGAESQIPSFLQPIATEIGAYEAKLMDDATCAAMQAHGGVCIRLLVAFNGPKGTDNAYAKGLLNLNDCCYPSQAGQRLIADLLYKTGLAPLTTP